MSSAGIQKYTREPQIVSYRPLESDVYGDDEFYIYKDGNNKEYVRKKIGGWINISKFYHLLENKYDVRNLDQEITKNAKKFHQFSKSIRNDRYQGVWISLKDARKFARTYDIIDEVAPILDFERIAMVNYSGRLFWEFFANVTIDMNVRMLREVNSSRINMRQVFVVYSKYKTDNDKVPMQERHFYNLFKANHADQISEKNDPTLCGGFWIAHEIAKQYCKKHGLLSKVRPILDFAQSPDEAEEFPIDRIQGYQRRFWRVTACQNGPYGFPNSFTGGNAPDPPTNSSGRNLMFSVDDLVTKKPIVGEVTLQHKSTARQVQVMRRYSDGWVNGSALVKAGCILRVKELDFGKDDPVMITLNELYYRDVLQSFNVEPVTHGRAPSLNGLWCSSRDARTIFTALKIEKTAPYHVLHQFLFDKTYDVEDDDENDEVDIINEADFGSTPRRRKEFKDISPPPNDKYFGDADSSEEASIEGFNSDTDHEMTNTEDIYEVIEIDEEDGDNENSIDYLFEPESDTSVKEEPQSQSILPPSDDFPHNSHFQEQMQEQQEQQQYHQHHEQQVPPQYSYHPSASQQQPIPDPPMSSGAKNRIIKEFESFAADLNDYSSKRALNGIDVKKVEALLEKLESYKSIDSKILITSMIEQSLMRFKARFNGHAKRIDAIVDQWKAARPISSNNQPPKSHSPHQPYANPSYSRRPFDPASGSFAGGASPPYGQPNEYSFQNQQPPYAQGYQHRGQYNAGPPPRFFNPQQNPMNRRPHQAKGNRNFPSGPTGKYGEYSNVKPAGPAQAFPQAHQYAQQLPIPQWPGPQQPQAHNIPQQHQQQQQQTPYKPTPNSNGPIAGAVPTQPSYKNPNFQSPIKSTQPCFPAIATKSRKHGRSNGNDHYPSSRSSYQPQEGSQSKRARERVSQDPQLQARDPKIQKVSSALNPDGKADSRSDSSTPLAEYSLPVKGPLPGQQKFHSQIQKLINDDDLSYTQLKLEKKDDGIHDAEKSNFVKVSSGNELVNAIFNNESVKKYKNLVHFKELTQKRQDLLKKRRTLFAGLIKPVEAGQNIPVSPSTVDFSKRLGLMITEKLVRKGGS